MVSSLWRGALVCGLAISVAGCGGPYAERRDESVARRYGNDVVEGPYVSPTAYEAYMVAMLQENAGRPDEAIDSLRRALGSDGTSAYLRMKLADALVATGRLDEARDELDAAQRLDPTSGEAWVVRARLRARLGDRAGVEDAFEHAIAVEPTLEEAYLSLAAAQREAGHDDRALATMRSLASRLPSAAAEDALGRAALRVRDRKAAREHLRRALELDASRNDARLELAKLALGDGDTELGLQLYAVVADRTRDPSTAMALARAMAIAGRHDDALAILDRLEEDARSIAGRLEIASALIDVGAVKRAELVADAVIADEKRPELRATAAVLRARAAEVEGAPVEAALAWEQLGPLDAGYTTAIVARARLLRDRGRDHEALALLETALTDRAARGFAEECDAISIALVEVSAELGERAAALRQLQQLVVARPRALAPKLALAKMERKAGRLDEAIALLQPLAKAGDVRAMHQLGDTIASSGQHLDEATKLLERAEGLQPHDAAIADSLGALYVSRGRLDDAERLLTRADRLAPPDVEVLTHLAALYAKRDDRDREAATLARALATHPPERERQKLEARLLMVEHGRTGAR